jgi:hypothetical protein
MPGEDGLSRVTRPALAAGQLLDLEVVILHLPGRLAIRQ